MSHKAETFEVYPAIDLRAGKVVRLVEGDPRRQTVYGHSPAGVARRWLDEGARWLHVVNLDGAFGEQDQGNLKALEEIMAEASKSVPPVKVQFGGGLRTIESVRQALGTGVQRVILGTAAIEKPLIVAGAISEFGADRVGIAFDVRDGRMQVRGWVEQVEENPIDLGARFYAMGLRTGVYTNVRRDGGGQGIDSAAAREFAEATGLAVIASGGVAAIEDVRLARQAGLSGVIVGRALYEGQVDLKEALQC